MAGKLSERQSEAVFETDDTVFDGGRKREVIVKLTPKYIEMRLKGLRNPVVTLSYSGLFMRQRLSAANGGG